MKIENGVFLAYELGAAGLALLAVEAAQTENQVVAEINLNVEKITEIVDWIQSELEYHPGF